MATNLLVHCLKDGERESVAPDVMVELGVDGSRRRSYGIREEGGRAPDSVLEVVSDSRQEKNAGEKRTTYAQLGCVEVLPLRAAERADGADGRLSAGGRGPA